jgi:hypothetical protein
LGDRRGGAPRGKDHSRAGSRNKPNPEVDERFRARHGIEAMLARPDFTVSGIARKADDVPKLIDDLHRQL